jgi:glycosyltransferase involved in cell wall biosynthesis
VDEHLAFAHLCNVEDRVHFLGFRKDVYKILKASDIFVFPSYREGLSVALTEAMACGLPVVASRIRGNIDLIDEELGGLLCKPTDVKSMAMHIDTLATNPEIRHKMGLYNYEKSKKYDKNIIIRKLMAMILEQINKNDENIAERKIKLENNTKEMVGINGDA